MKMNPTTLSWLPPSKNADGTPIDYDLAYELGVLKDGKFVPSAVLPATLNAGRYEAPVADMALPAGEITVALRTMATDDPTRVSTWSEPVSFYISDRVPAPPLDLQVS